MNIDEILDRAKSSVGMRYDSDLARYFGKFKTAASNWRSRGTIPIDELMALAVLHNISLDWLLLGRGHKEYSEACSAKITVDPDRTHADLLHASKIIGDLIECSAWYTQGLAERLAKDGYDVNSMTVSELIRACTHYHNAASQ